MELPVALLLPELQLREPTPEAERRWKLNKNIHQLEQTPQVEEEFKSLW